VSIEVLSSRLKRYLRFAGLARVAAGRLLHLEEMVDDRLDLRRGQSRLLAARRAASAHRSR
jgi:hypothetical protein